MTINSPTFILQNENVPAIPPSLSTSKLLNPTTDHSQFYELWPHELWDYDFNVKGTSWESLPQLPILQHDPLEPTTSPQVNNLSKSVDSVQSPTSKSDSPSKHPSLSFAELDLAKPHPHAVFCPLEWKWVVLSCFGQEGLPSQCSSTINPSSTSDPPMLLDHGPLEELNALQNPSQPDPIGYHFFQRFKGVVRHAKPDSLRPQPISIFDQDGRPILELPAVTTEPSGPPLGWDAMICCFCHQGMALSPVESSISSVFPKSDALALIQHMRLFALGQSSTSNQPASKPEQVIYKAWHTVFIVIQNALIDSKHSSLPLDGKSFSGRMPWNPVSERIWSHLGAKRRDDNDRPLLTLPSLNVRTPEGRQNRAKWVRALIEISVFLRWMKIMHPFVEESYKSSYQVPLNLKPATPRILKMLGGDQVPRAMVKTAWKNTDGRPSGYASYAALGILPDVKDEIVTYAYQLQCFLYPYDQYRFFHHLREICILRGEDSTSLQLFVTQQQDRGAVGMAEARESWELICGDRHEFDLEKEDLIASCLNAKLDSARDKDERNALRRALRNLLFANPLSQLLRALLDSTSALDKDSPKPEMNIDKAYATLGDVVPETEDDLLWMAYEIATMDQPGQKKILRQAIEVIAHHRDSQNIKARLEAYHDGTANSTTIDLIPWCPPAPAFDLPVGLNNIGNTCYLNSLLQYFFSVRELRDVLLRFPEYAQSVTDDEPSKEWKRVGGRVVSKPEVTRSKQFASQLQGLFQEMIITRQSAVTPERELAFLALVLPQDDGPFGGTADKTSNHNNNNNNSSASTDATLVDERSAFIGPLANPQTVSHLPVNSPSSTVLGKRKSESSDTEDDRAMEIDHPPVGPAKNGSDLNKDNDDVQMSSLSPPRVLEGDGDMTHPTSLPFIEFPAGRPVDLVVTDLVDPGQVVPPSSSQSTLQIEHIEENAQQAIVIDLTEEGTAPVHFADAPPPPLPPRPNRSRSLAVTDNGSHMMFGRQNDVSECMDNCLFQIQAALDETKLSASYGEEGNIVKSLFHGRTRQSLAFDAPEGKVSVKEEPFAYLLVDVAEEGRDLYDGLDRVFDESEVDVENGKATRSVGLVHLPPILQIQLQRVQFDRRTHTVFKSNAYIKFDEILRMDRYMEPDPDDPVAMERRKKTMGCRKEIESLRGRLNELTAHVAGGKHTSSVVLRDLHALITTESGNHLPLMNFFEDLIKASDVEYLMTEANAIEEEIQLVNQRVEVLRKEVDEMWRVEETPSEMVTNLDTVVEASGISSSNHHHCGAEYRLVSLFMHRGTATGGHYWAIQRQLPDKPSRWLKYNDSLVSEVDPRLEVFNETKDSSANPYWLTYVRVGEEDRFEMVKREFGDDQVVR